MYLLARFPANLGNFDRNNFVQFINQNHAMMNIHLSEIEYVDDIPDTLAFALILGGLDQQPNYVNIEYQAAQQQGYMTFTRFQIPGGDEQWHVFDPHFAYLPPGIIIDDNLEKILNKIDLTKEQINRIDELSANDNFIKEFILKSQYSALYRNSNEYYISALKDMLVKLTPNDQDETNLVKQKMQIACGDCPTPVITSIVTHSFAMRIQANDPIDELEFSRFALMDYLSKKIKNSQNEDKIEIINGMVNAIFSKNARTMNNGIFKIKENAALQKFDSISAYEEFGYAAIKENHVTQVKELLGEKTNEGYELNFDKIKQITSDYKKEQFGIVDDTQKYIDEIDKQLIEYFLINGKTFFENHPWKDLTETDRKHEILKQFKKLQETNPNHSNDKYVEKLVNNEKLKFKTLENAPAINLTNEKNEYLKKTDDPGHVDGYNLQKLAFIAVSRRKSGFFHPLNTTNSADNLLEVINSRNEYGENLRKIMLEDSADRKIRMRDLRAFAIDGPDGVKKTSTDSSLNQYDKDNERFFSFKHRENNQTVNLFFDKHIHKNQVNIHKNQVNIQINCNN